LSALFRKPPALDPATRPTRLPVWGQCLAALLLLASFFSGVAIWWGQTLQAEEMVTPAWLRGTVILHGALNPVQCVLFGVLLCHHIRVGWQLRANLLAGFLLEAMFAGLIVTGAGLHYAPESWRDRLILTHRIFGLALPITLGLHWLVAHFWIRRVTALPRN
jgi:hypothetical protein